MNEERIQVVGVCDNEATVYDLSVDGFRAFVRRYLFSNYGQARQFAQEYEDGQRRAVKSRLKTGV